MTGYGRARWSQGDTEIDVELRSVNNRYLKLHFTVPDGLVPFQQRLEQVLRESLARGTISMTIKCRSSNLGAPAMIDIGCLRSYEAQLDELAREGNLPASTALTDLLALPGVVVEGPPSPLSEELAAQVLETTSSATRELVAARVAEGKHLEATLHERVRLMAEATGQIRERVKSTPAEIMAKLQERLNALLSGEAGVAPADIAREAALLADRADVTEELDRLDAHLHRFVELLALERLPSEGCGRELEFFSQEMLREANTIASKSVDPEVTHLVVGIKSEIDRLKEQLQNVE